MTDQTQFNYNLLENLGTVLMSRVEDEFINLTYHFTKLLRQGIDAQQSFQAMAEERLNNGMEDWNRSTQQFRELATQSDQRNQKIASLERRLDTLEETVAMQLEVGQLNGQPVAVSETRVAAIEDSISSVESLAAGMTQQSDSIAGLEARLASIEERLQQLSDLATVVHQQRQLITHLEERLISGEFNPPHNHLEADRAF